MAKDDKSNYNEQRYFDIVPPNRKSPEPSSRPVVVTNHPEQSDPMVKTSIPEFMEESTDLKAEKVPTEAKLPDDVTIDNESTTQESAVEPSFPDNEQPLAETTPQPTETPTPEIDPNEPLLPAHATPDVTTSAVTASKTSKSHKGHWIVVTIIVLLIAAGAVGYFLNI